MHSIRIIASWLLWNGCLGDTVEANSLDNAEICCPSNGPFMSDEDISCFINCDGRDLMRQTDIFEVEGFNDITIQTQTYSTNWCYRAGQIPMTNGLCDIDMASPSPTISPVAPVPSPSPTSLPTSSPTTIPTLNPSSLPAGQSSAPWASMSIVGLFIIVIAFGLSAVFYRKANRIVTDRQLVTDEEKVDDYNTETKIGRFTIAFQDLPQCMNAESRREHKEHILNTMATRNPLSHRQHCVTPPPPDNGDDVRSLAWSAPRYVTDGDQREHKKKGLKSIKKKKGRKRSMTIPRIKFPKSVAEAIMMEPLVYNAKNRK